MRLLYFSLGVLIGMFYTSRLGIEVCNNINREWERQITPFTLTGYAEGWTRGRDHAEARMMQQLQACWQAYKCLKGRI